MSRQKVNITDADQYSVSGFVNRVEGCNAILFTNIGDTICQVNGQTVFPSLTPATSLGDSRVIAVRENQEYVGKIVIKFRQPLGANPLIELAQMYYVD